MFPLANLKLFSDICVVSCMDVKVTVKRTLLTILFISLHALVLFLSHFTKDESVLISIRGVNFCGMIIMGWWIRNVIN